MLDTLPLAETLPAPIRMRTELAREIRRDPVAHAIVENSLIHRITASGAAFDDKVTRDYLGGDWDRYVQILADDDALEGILRTAEPAIACVSPVTLALILGNARKLPYDPTPFARYTSNQIVNAATGRGPVTIVASWPPRHGKTTLISRRSSEWLLINYPNKSAAILGYNDSFASDHGKTARNDVEDSPEIFGFGIRADSSAAAAWHTTFDGGVWTAGVHGSATGKGADLLICDDTTKDWADANSLASRDETWSWYGTTARTRLQQGGITCLIHTRWHEDDLTGRVLRSTPANEIKEIRFPAICESESDEIGRKKGEALWPGKYDLEWLARARREGGEEAWFALYQQSPLGASSVGRAYPAFERDKHVKEVVFDASQRVYVSMDFNIDSMLLILGQVDELTSWRDNSRQFMLRIFDELCLPDRRTEEACDVLCERLRRWGRGNKLQVVITGDASARQRRTSMSDLGHDLNIIRNYFGSRPGLFSTTYDFSKSNESVRESVGNVQSMLKTADGRSHLIIDPRCVELIEDLRTNRWDRDARGNFLDVLDKKDPRRTHAGDAIRYLIRSLRKGMQGYGPQPVAIPGTY